MTSVSHIPWCDNSVPVVVGCTTRGEGCRNCYAVGQAWRFGETIAVNEEELRQLSQARRLAIIDGTLCVLKLPFRMLQNDELARATSFPEHYRFCGSAEDITRQIGNAVPVHTATAHIDALFQE